MLLVNLREAFNVIKNQSSLDYANKLIENILISFNTLKNKSQGTEILKSIASKRENISECVEDAKHLRSRALIFCRDLRHDVLRCEDQIKVVRLLEMLAREFLAKITRRTCTMCQ